MFTWIKRNYPLFVIIGACIIAFNFFNEKEGYINQYNAKIEALEQKVDSLHHENGELTFKIDTLNQQVSKLDQELDLKDNKINNLRYEISTKVDAVDNFNNNELEKFFTDRYKEIITRQHQDSVN